MRELQVEAITCPVYISAGEKSTEDLVVQFYRDMEVHGGGGEEHVEAVKLAGCWGGELPPEPDDGQAAEVARICDKNGMILPTYDIKKLKLHSMKPQKMMNSLNTQFQEGQEKVKTKKKVSKSPSRRLPQLQSWLLISPDSPW